MKNTLDCSEKALSEASCPSDHGRAQGQAGESGAARHQMNHLETLLETFQRQAPIYLLDITRFL